MLTVIALLLLQAQPTPRDLGDLLAPFLESSGVPALGAAVVSSEGLVAVGAVGLRSWKGEHDVTVDDRWHLGSCTKALTATLVARLVEREVLAWDTTLAEVFPEGIDPAWRKVTVLQLLCHRSGAALNFEQELWEQMVAAGGELRAQRAFFVREGLARPPEFTPDTRTSYSNAGYVVAAALLERRTDTAFEELMQRELFTPLGMTHAGFGAPGTPGLLDQPLGHVRGGERWAAIELGPGADNPAAGNPAGGAHATLADWARFVSAHLRREPSFLSEASWNRLHTVASDGAEYAPGWLVGEAEWARGPLLHHLGSNGFWGAEASLAPARNLAILVVTNVGDDAAAAPFRDVLALLAAQASSR